MGYFLGDIRHELDAAVHKDNSCGRRQDTTSLGVEE